MKARYIDPALLRRLLRYDPETGKLFWRSRPVDMFTSTRDPRGAAWACATWNAKNAGKEAFTATSQGYRAGAILGRVYRAHRVIWALVHGEWPNTLDHINGDRSDNRLSNLRAVSRLENQRNMRRYASNKSGVNGVSWSSERRRWRASISVRGQTIHLGRFRDKATAIAARKAAEAEHGFHSNHGRQA